MSEHTRTIMGHELEYAVVVLDERGERMDDSGINMLESLAVRLDSSLPWDDRGFAMLNGARFYRDPGGNNAHIEIATAEVTNPVELVAQVEAGHRFMLRAAAELKKKATIGGVVVGRHNVDYSTHPTTWGSHESFYVPVNGPVRETGETDDDIPF